MHIKGFSTDLHILVAFSKNTANLPKMTEAAKLATLKKRVIVDIKAIVVVNAKAGVSLPYLNQEYKEQNGCDIPFKELGETSLQNFLKSIPEVVRLETRGYETRVYPIADEKNAHIVKLVCLTQKNKKGGKFKRGGRSYAPYRSTSSYNSSPYGFNRGRLISTSRPLNQALKCQASVPVESREKIEKTLSLAGDCGVEIEDFETNFLHYNGMKLSYTNFGFNSLKDCLKSIPNIVTLRGNGAGKTYCISTAELKSK